MVKKLIPMTMLVIVLSLAINVGTASAMTPMPFGVKVVNEGNLGGYEFTQTNLRTGEIITLITNSDGHNSFDWSNAKFGWLVGDTMKVVLLDCEDNPKCTKTVVIEPTPTNLNIGMPIAMTIDLTGEVCAICIECEECPEDTTPFKECDSCCPTDITPYGECDSCCEAEECPDPENPQSIIEWILGLGVVGALGIAGYITKAKISRTGEDDFSKALNEQLSDYSGARYFKQNGRTLVKHIHIGIKGYHSPDVVHINPKWRHEKGRTNV